jgi:hypothetical protein
MEPQALSTLVQLGIAGNPISLHGSHIYAKLWSSLPLGMPTEHNTPHYLSRRAPLDKRRNGWLSIIQEADKDITTVDEFESLWEDLEQAPYLALDTDYLEVSCEWQDDTNVTE